MMEVEIADSLVRESKVAQTINGYLMPKNGTNTLDFSYLRLSNVYSCVIVDSQGKDVIAIAAVIRYSKSQAYCCLAQVEEAVRNRLIRLDRGCPFSLADAQDSSENHCGAQVMKSREGWRNPMDEPLYMIHYRHKSRPALDQILETVMERALGVHNMELRKNVTIDLSGKDMWEWRDRIGFCVTDSREFLEIQLSQGSRLGDLLKESPRVTVQSCQDVAAIIDFDRQVSQMDRAEYLSFLSKLKGSQVFVAHSVPDEEVTGFLISFDGTILCLYATSEEAGRGLLKASVSESNGKPLTLTTVSGSWIEEICNDHPEIVSSLKSVHRYHTTAPPKQINWDFVHVLNCGIHIV